MDELMAEELLIMSISQLEDYLSELETYHIKKYFQARTPELPDPCTPEQYKEITGETFSDDGAMWIRSQLKYNFWSNWSVIKYGNIPTVNDSEYFIVQTGKPAPKTEWRPG